MPLVKVQSSKEPEDKTALLADLSGAVSEVTGKPQQYIMAVLDTASFMMEGKETEAAFVEIRGIGGVNGETNRALSEKVCSIINQRLSIPANRIYINFFDISASNWGWNGSTFG